MAGGRPSLVMRISETFSSSFATSARRALSSTEAAMAASSALLAASLFALLAASFLTSGCSHRTIW